MPATACIFIIDIDAQDIYTHSTQGAHLIGRA